MQHNGILKTTVFGATVQDYDIQSILKAGQTTAGRHCLASLDSLPASPKKLISVDPLPDKENRLHVLIVQFNPMLLTVHYLFEGFICATVSAKSHDVFSR